MATYPIFAHENGQRIAVNPDHVVSLTEIGSQRILISFPKATPKNYCFISANLGEILEFHSGWNESRSC